MKLLLETWRKFLKEETAGAAGVKYSGILKIVLEPDVVAKVEAMQTSLPEEAQRLDAKDLHVTLIHQSVLKPFRKEIKNKIKTGEFNLPPHPPVLLEDDVWERESTGKKSWAVRLENQDEMRNYVKEVMTLLGSQNTNPEPERVFHVSLANLTGHPTDSVR